MRTVGRRPADDVRHHVARLALWRALAAAPAVLCSLLVLTLASGALGRWAGLLLLAWAAGAGALMTRIGERLAVRAGLRLARPSPAQAEAIQSAWATALQVTGTQTGDVDLYVRGIEVPNAYAAGGRSVAVTRRVVEDYREGRLPENQLVAMLVHELGHHATGATRPVLLLSWITAPWRLAANLLIGLGSTLAGRQSRPGQVIVMVAGLAVAVMQALQQGQWKVGGVLVSVGLAAVLCPLCDAAISRRSEFAADRFAADLGLASELASALHGLDEGSHSACGWWRRMRASHPTSEQRIRALSATTYPR